MMMGKTQRFSREGYSSGFVSDHRHAVETMCESEGFGSSGRVEMEMTAWEDSRAPKRKCISLNVDTCDSFNVPLKVLSVSKMSTSERRELKVKLRSELEQVLIIQKKFFSSCADETTVSASSDIRSYSDGRRRVVPENFYKSSKVSSMPVKKLPSMGQKGATLKRGISDRFESNTQTAYCRSKNATLMKQCEMLLKQLMSHKFGGAFQEPVDPVKLNIPDYFSIIKHPMDFGTIKCKIASGAYSSPLDFAADVRLTFTNALTYNPPGNYVHNDAVTLSKFFESRWKPIEKKLPVSNSPQGPAKSGICREIKAAMPRPSQSRKRKQPSTMNHNVNIERMKRTMTAEEKLSLTRDLESVQGDMPEQIFDFLRAGSCSTNSTSEAELEVDMDALSDDTLFTLRKLVDDHLLEKHKIRVNAEACEIELLNESGLSNLSMQPCKVNDAADEDVDVDIGGNDPPVSSYPPVEIDKDTALRTSKCSSSSSSSSDSDSSSSDSDSGSSSGSESNGAKVLPGKNVKETIGSEAGLDQERSDVLDPHNENRSVNGLDQTENSTQSKQVSTEVDGLQEGENAPSERQVSPEKLHRAALLRGRFVDTILRAREKTLKCENGDPEKLRREKEELERQQRAEKARLQAEAKAAEDFRRQAEAEAAAEAKRKREIEREAARMALQKMEKTVEINENCQFLKDLEMLGAAPTEHLPSSVDETSPDHSQDGMGSFKLMGSNPLAQLGLYMKVDEEDDDECDPERAPLNDVEEGEID